MTNYSPAEFRQIVQRHRTQAALETRTQEAERQKDQARVERSTQLTTGSIVGSLAELQIEFGRTLDSLITRLDQEYERLNDVRRARAVQAEHLQELSEMRVVADALYVQRLEHDQHLRRLDEEAAQDAERLARERSDQRGRWDEEEAAAGRTRAAREAAQEAQQAREAAEFTYSQSRERQQQQDDLNREGREFERDSAEELRLRERDWAEREAVLLKAQPLRDAEKAKLDAFPAELAELVNKTRTEAIEEVSREAKIRADLLDREWEGQKKVFEYRITALDATLERQTAQIASLTEQLQDVMKQAQDLALRAVTSYSQKA